MGEARKRAEWRRLDFDISREISRARFDFYTLGTRLAPSRFMAEELSWWSDESEALLGVVVRDFTDNDFGWIVLARDDAGRFRAVDLNMSLRSREYATNALRLAIARILKTEDLDALGAQGDEPTTPIDLLTIPPDFDRAKLHPYFLELHDSEGRAPARAAIREMGPWLAPADSHLVSEFQQHQFDQRLWEIYLWASFRELSFDVTNLEAPDFSCRSPLGEFTVEATTVAPSMTGPLAAHPNPKTHGEMTEFLENYMPLKYGSSLMSKLRKTNGKGQHYWEMERARDASFLLAVADFHKAATEDELGSMTYTQSSIWQYLYGLRVKWEIVDGRLVLLPTKVAAHEFGDKKAPSGFFDQPDAENVSAVLFSNAGTIAKFDRMGALAGFGAPDCTYFRVGLKADPDPNSPVGVPFSVRVGIDDYTEMWSDELQVFHNPNAVKPLPKRMFNGIAQHWFENGDLMSIVPEDHVLSSFTAIMHVGAADEESGRTV